MVPLMDVVLEELRRAHSAELIERECADELRLAAAQQQVLSAAEQEQLRREKMEREEDRLLRRVQARPFGLMVVRNMRDLNPTDIDTLV